jgi:hypothetical protein
MQVHTLWSASARRRVRWLTTTLTIMSVLALAVGSAAIAFADNPSGCDFAATGTTQSCAPPLAGSTFAGGDGNLLASPTTYGSTDWQNVAGLNHGVDKPGGSSDNSFGQGTKEDNPNVTVVTGSIPNNKSDLTRFYEASEIGSNGDNFLYLAWERANVLGSANMDFEINQSATAGFTGTTTGPLTLNRTAGDLLVTFDFTNGGGRPTLGLLTWLTAAAGNTASQCFSSNALPCWGKQETLNGTDSNGAVNNLDAVSDPLFPAEGNYQNPVPALQFGETAVDLTTAGVFPTGICKAFGSAFVKSRASASFTAEVKDFIAPIPVNISNCGTITIHKTTIPAGGTGFNYTTTGASPLGGSFSLDDGGTKTYTDVPTGSFSVTESAKTGWDLVSLTCTATGTGTSASTSGATASITMAAGGVVDCTYTNHIHAAPTIATTLSATTGNIGDAVHDSATLSGATADAGGTVTYSVYTDSACTLGKQDAGTKTVTNGVVPDSNSITFNSAGTFYWQAVYSGDGKNNGATSPCMSEQLVVKPNQSAITTAQNLLPNDSATITGATSNAGGTITFNLYSPSDGTCSLTPAFTQTVTVSGNGTYSTTNTTFLATADGTWRWQVVYSGDANNVGSTSACGVESFTITNG